MRTLNIILAVLCLLGLAYDASTVFAHVALDPNEGWNAYHTAAAMARAPLYPQGWFTNNYPPLSFYAVGAVGGDAIFAGRIVAFLSLLAVAGAIFAAARRLGVTANAAVFGGLWFVAGLIVFTDYVAMDDPQLLGHAVMMGGLLLLLRDRPVAAALAMTVALFVKHNLIALPVASVLWLAWSDRRAAMKFAVTGLAAGLAGLLLFRLVYGIGLSGVLNSPRLYSLASLTGGVTGFAAWSFGAMLVASMTKDVFARIYVVTAALVGAAFSGGAGVDMNAWFDAAIALSLAAALALDRSPLPWRADVLAGVMLFPLALGLLHGDRWDPPVDATPDIAFLKSHEGSALCEMLSLCYWAGKPAEVDVFNLGQRYATGAESDAALADAIAKQRFAVVQMDSLDDLTPRIKAGLLTAYRLDHEDDSGVFLVRRSRP